jgi:hypothetical protein
MAAQDSLDVYRSDPASMVPAARAMYERGHSRDEVLEGIYGVRFPAEALLTYREFVTEQRPLNADWFTHPWELMRTLPEGGPSHKIGASAANEERAAFLLAPNVVPLCVTGYDGALHGGSVIGYDLDELRAGRTTVVGLEGKTSISSSSKPFEVFGPSLLDVFRDLIQAYVGVVEGWIRNRTHAFTQDDIEEFKGHLAAVEDLKKEVSDTR